MKTEIFLPNDVHSVEYVKNSHYLRLTDNDDNSTVMFAKGFIRYKCKKCDHVFWMDTNVASICPTGCGAKTLEQQWGSLQLGFMPESESDFVPPKQKDEDEDKENL